MAYFPDAVMPKMLKKETSSEVDGSPLIYNAKDYNKHHREIRSIEAVALGTSSLAKSISSLTSEIFDGSLMTQYSGVLTVPFQIIPDKSVTSTKTSGALLSSGTTITVDSTDGFPQAGYITKFNSNPITESCSAGGTPGGGGYCPVGQFKVAAYASFLNGPLQRTNQELISYNGKTETEFLNCTREANGTTSEDVASSDSALIISGQACLWLTSNFWSRNKVVSSHNQFYISHDALLNVTAALLEQGSIAVLKPNIADLIEVSYLLTIIGGFDDENIDKAFGG